MKNILVIDDEEMIVDALKVILEDLGHRVTGISESPIGEREALNHDYDLILVDLRMPGKNGAEVSENILKAKPSAKILIITAHPADPLAERALSAGAVGLVKKPFDMGKILEYLKD